MVVDRADHRVAPRWLEAREPVVERRGLRDHEAVGIDDPDELVVVGGQWERAR